MEDNNKEIFGKEKIPFLKRAGIYLDDTTT